MKEGSEMMGDQNLVNFLRALVALGFEPEKVEFSKGNAMAIDYAEVKMRDNLVFCVTDGTVVVSDFGDTWHLLYSETPKVFSYKEMILQLSETCMSRLKNEQ